MKNLHEIYPNYHLNADTWKPYYYRKSFTDTPLMAIIVISASNTKGNKNKINMKDSHEVYPNFHLYADILKLHFYMKYFNDTSLIATIVISASNTTRDNSNINMKYLHEIYPDFHLRTHTLKLYFYKKVV